MFYKKRIEFNEAKRKYKSNIKSDLQAQTYWKNSIFEYMISELNHKENVKHILRNFNYWKTFDLFHYEYRRNLKIKKGEKTKEGFTVAVGTQLQQ